MAVYTYLIQSIENGDFYTGISVHTNRRLIEHNSGKLKTTSSKKPWRLVFAREHETYDSARRHEKWLKKKNTEYKSRLVQLAPPVSEGQGKAP